MLFFKREESEQKREHTVSTPQLFSALQGYPR